MTHIKDGAAYWNEWLKDWMVLWGSVSHNPYWDTLWMGLVSRLAKLDKNGKTYSKLADLLLHSLQHISLALKRCISRHMSLRMLLSILLYCPDQVVKRCRSA